MSGKIFVGLLATVLLGAVSAQAQQPKRVPRIGVLTNQSPSEISARIEVFRQGLRQLGYVEGKNIVIERRSAGGKLGRLPDIAAELVRLKVDVIVSGGDSTTQAAKKATNTIPIVMTQSSDPVAAGFVASLARPVGNITGLSQLAPELSGKRLEMLREIMPKLSRVAVFGTSTSVANAEELKEVETAAGALGVKVQYIEVLSPKDLEAAFRAAAKGRADAVLFQVSGGVSNVWRKEIVELAVKSRLLVMFETTTFVEAGGLMSYGVNSNDLARRAATFVDKILKGAKPADLPVEQPTKFEFIVNLKAAKQIGLTIPPNVLARADRVIK